MKDLKDQKFSQRKPQQERAQQKVELILEAAILLLDKGGLAALTTNAVAEKAGVSIGTLYQYFGNKEAILDALADKEMAAMSGRVLAALQDPGAPTPAERIARVVRAVAASYGGRRQVYRIVMEHSLSRGGRRLSPLIQRLVALLTDGRRPVPISHAEAFVLTNAFAGVMRGMILWQGDDAPPLDQVEAGLVRLIIGFTDGGVIGG